MINDVDGRRLITTFQHVQPNPETKERGGTWCFVKVYDPALKDEQREVVATGFAAMYFKDKDFNKQVGRKWALQYALGLDKAALKAQHVKGRKESASVYGAGFTKEQRQAIWTEYFRTHRVGPLNRAVVLANKLAKAEAVITKLEEALETHGVVKVG